jgi:hypothetical protein
MSELGVIYAYTNSAGDAGVVTIVFLDRSGEILFRIAPHPVAKPIGRETDEMSKETFRRMQALPQTCGKT